jgi:hypothetical protein
MNDDPRHDDPRHDDPRHDDHRHDDHRHDDLRHAEAHELIADLALEPGALARLVAVPGPEDAGSGRELREPGADDVLPALPDRERLAALRAHVSACPDCRRDVDAWLLTHARLDEATQASGRDRQATLGELGAERPILAPPALRERIRTEIARDPRAAAGADRAGSASVGNAASGLGGSASSAVPSALPEGGASPEAAPASARMASASPAPPEPPSVTSEPPPPPATLEAPRTTPEPPPATLEAPRTTPEPPPATLEAPGRLVDFRRPSRIWRAALPLVAALAVLVGGFAVVRDQQTRIDTARAEAAELETLAASLDRLLADPDHRVVALAAADGSARGTLAWSKHEIVVMSSALARPPAGSEYRCWLERDGKRTRVGTMWFAGDLAYWSGTLDDWATISFDQGGRFGVSLEKADGAGGGAPVLLGQLSG